MYAGVVFSMAVIGATVFASLRGPAPSQSGSPAIAAGSGIPVAQVNPSQHIYHGEFGADGRRGSFGISLRFAGPGRVRSWVLRPGSGQYAGITGRGQGFQVGGHAAAWSARIVGLVRVAGARRQKVVISLRGRPDGSFVLVPTAPGVLQRDSGTQSSGWLG